MVKLTEQADGPSGDRYHKWLKKKKSRLERRRAKKNLDCIPLYKKFRGYEM